MNENIKNIAEIIAVSIVGDTADDEDIQSSTPIATALHKAGYRKQSDTVKEFAEQYGKED